MHNTATAMPHLILFFFLFKEIWIFFRFTILLLENWTLCLKWDIMGENVKWGLNTFARHRIYLSKNLGRANNLMTSQLWKQSLSNKSRACGWSCQNHRITGRKHSLTDGWQECRRGRRSRRERHTKLCSLTVRECVISQGAKACSSAKARHRQTNRGRLWGWKDSRWCWIEKL